tara:strand:+ start:886 stop:1071 length:186 start_codon:yes stop_codon:yes gene_type:complete
MIEKPFTPEEIVEALVKIEQEELGWMNLLNQGEYHFTYHLRNTYSNWLNNCKIRGKLTGIS